MIVLLRPSKVVSRLRPVPGGAESSNTAEALLHTLAYNIAKPRIPRGPGISGSQAPGRAPSMPGARSGQPPQASIKQAEAQPMSRIRSNRIKHPLVPGMLGTRGIPCPNQDWNQIEIKDPGPEIAGCWSRINSFPPENPRE